MSLILLNLDSNQQIKLDNQNPLIIGRKNVEGCFDKRVSRNHGRVTCTIDGKLRLEALHFNPCFFTRNGVPPVLQLNKDEEETLSEGDYLGLLPNAFWFKITSDKVTKIKTRPDNFENTSIDQGSEENIRTGNLHDNRSVTNPESDKTVTIRVKDSSVSNNEVNEGSLNPLPVPTSDSVINSTGLSKGFGSEEFEKTRRLPLWMYEIYDPMEGNKSSKKHTSPKHTSQKGQKKQKPLLVAETDRSSRAVFQVNGNGPDLGFASTSKATTEDKLAKTEEKLAKIEVKLAKTMPLKKETENGKAPEDHVSGGRATCENGAMCSIQNPQHTAQFCHPGDEDYVPLVEQTHYEHGPPHYDEHEKKLNEVSEQTEVPYRSGHSQDESVIPPQPLKRSRKRTKVHSENDYVDDNDDADDYVVNDYDGDDDDDDDDDQLDASDEEHEPIENIDAK